MTDLTKLVRKLEWTPLSTSFMAEDTVFNTVAIAADTEAYDRERAARVIAALDADLLAEVVGALSFYADPDENGYDAWPEHGGLTVGTGRIIDDAGDKARAILAKLGAV